MSDTTSKLHLFDAIGVELEYMIVDRDSLDVRPIADRIIESVVGEIASDFEDGPIAWSNELALHVIELKTNGPAADTNELPTLFQANINRVNSLASEFDAQLMPTAMHPWMDPHTELQLWPHDYNPVYEAYNRIFDCRGHGWANLQSTHINLPFFGDEEFARLHAAIRLILPLIPAIAASSPVADGRLTGFVDYRMEVYRKNSAKIPSITGRVIPEQVYSKADYEEQIFARSYRDIAPFDHDKILQQPFLNSRGAIARFERGAIEIRVVDIQECAAADLAITELIVAALKLIVNESYVPLDELKQLETDALADLFLEVIRTGERTSVTNQDILRALGVANRSASAGEIWASIYETANRNDARTIGVAHRPCIEAILNKGPLARRICGELGGDTGNLVEIYRELCDCLAQGQMFAT
ncbi:MAG: glutamate-cysteine ligase family protein [Pirellulaceae bacterium]